MGRPRPARRGDRHRAGAGRQSTCCSTSGTPASTTRCRRRTGTVSSAKCWCFACSPRPASRSQVYQLYLNQWLQIRWRSWMTSKYLGDWMHDANHYRMQLQGDAADNPDQRMTDDVKLFVEQTLDIGLGLLSSIVTLASFVVILWGLVSGSAAASVRQRFRHPRLSGLGRADLRHLRHRADAVDRLAAGQPRFQPAAATRRTSASTWCGCGKTPSRSRCCKGEPAERERLSERFSRVVDNWYGIMSRTKRLTAFTQSYAQAAVVFPYVLVAPAYFANKIQLGGADADRGRLRQACRTRCRSSSRSTARWRNGARWSPVSTGLRRAIASAATLPTEPGSIGMAQTATARDQPATASGAACPTARRWSPPTASAFAPASARWSPDRPAPANRRCSAPSPASGRSATARSPFPPSASLMMLPQRPYFPIGSLHAAIVYPGETESFTADQVRDVLAMVGLPQLGPRLDEEAHWNRMLSLGEQQRLGLARALLHAPNYLFLDEATASLDEPSEAALYSLLAEKLPDTTIVSIGHRSTLDAFHQRNISWCATATASRCRTASWRRFRSRRSSIRATSPDLQPAPRPGLAAHPAVPDIGRTRSTAPRRPAPAPAGTSMADCLIPPAAD